MPKRKRLQPIKDSSDDSDSEVDVVEISERSSDVTKSPARPRSLAGRRKSSRHSIHVPQDTKECCICHVMKNEVGEELLHCSKCSTAGITALMSKKC